MPLRRDDPTPEPSGPPCSVCQGAHFRDCWGYPVCEPCSLSWAASPECKAVQLELDPLPSWQLARMEPSQRPPEPTEHMRREAYRRAVKAWGMARKQAVAA